MNAGDIFFIYPLMALGTGDRDVVTVDGRGRIRGRKLFMGRVTAGTACRHDQAFLQLLAMDAFCKIPGDIVFCPFVKHRCLLSLTMAAAAKSRDIGGIGRGSEDFMGQYPVRAVTILARRGIGIAGVE